MSLDDTDALRALLVAVEQDSEELSRRFYTHWFAADSSVRDLFPPDMGAQRAAFMRALTWLFGQLIAQRTDEPVAFLAQLGRDHRKFGVARHHYDSMAGALYSSLRGQLGPRWNDRISAAAAASITLLTEVMRGAADAEPGPPWWDATVVERIGVSRDIAVVRLQLDRPMQYHAGQYVNVHVPQWPRRWRYLSPAIPPDPDGSIEFHVRAVAGGMVSTAVVAETSAGDRWRLSSPHGALHVDRDAGDVLMVAGSTGLAPLRALIMDLTRWGVNPRVHVFFGARYPCELYDLRTLWEIASQHPWLSVSPVTEYTRDPPWAADYPDVHPPRGLHITQRGRLPEVVTSFGNWGDRQILLAGRPAMVESVKAALIAKGAPAGRIQHDPPAD